MQALRKLIPSLVTWPVHYASISTILGTQNKPNLGAMYLFLALSLSKLEQEVS